MVWGSAKIATQNLEVAGNVREERISKDVQLKLAKTFCSSASSVKAQLAVKIFHRR